MQPVGLKKMPDLEKWISFDESRKQRGVMSIVGFGGAGKTTAAVALYRELGPQFQCRAVVTVSQNADAEVVLRDILAQVKPKASNGEQQIKDSCRAVLENKIPVIGSILSRIRLPSRNPEDNAGTAGQDKLHQIKTELCTHLKTNRYLLLIDDVWSSSLWQNIKNCFPDNSGGKIIVTTRFQAGAVICSARKDHDLVQAVEVLSGDEPKRLFQKTVSEYRGTGDSQPNQIEVPDRVWEMCGGLPLAIVTMAGLVASKPLMNEGEWFALCNFLFPEPEKCRKPEDFMRIINYCYNDLPGAIKICTLYLSIFPKGHKVSRKRLIRRWIAEGFVREKQGLSIEDVAETCFNQLMGRKIIRPVEHNINGRVKSCQVHDMVLECWKLIHILELEKVNSYLTTMKNIQNLYSWILMFLRVSFDNLYDGCSPVVR